MKHTTTRDILLDGLAGLRDSTHTQKQRKGHQSYERTRELVGLGDTKQRLHGGVKLSKRWFCALLHHHLISSETTDDTRRESLGDWIVQGPIRGGGRLGHAGPRPDAVPGDQ